MEQVKDHNEIDNLFKSSLENFEYAPSGNAWNMLEKNSEILTAEKGHLSWLKWVFMLMSLLITFTIYQSVVLIPEKAEKTNNTFRQHSNTSERKKEENISTQNNAIVNYHSLKHRKLNKILTNEEHIHILPLRTDTINTMPNNSTINDKEPVITDSSLPSINKVNDLNTENDNEEISDHEKRSIDAANDFRQDESIESKEEELDDGKYSNSKNLNREEDEQENEHQDENNNSNNNDQGNQ